MRSARRDISVMRDIGTALAVTAIWLLSLLAPLHQASGLGRDLAERGYEPAVIWSLCDPAGAGDDAADRTQALCPLQGLAKALLFVAFVVAAGLILPPLRGVLRIWAPERPSRAPPPYLTPPSRGPPLFA